MSAADFLRFLMRWHHIEPEFRLDGPTGLVGVLESLEGFEIPAVAWEQDILPSRLSHYSTTWLDQLCLSGDLVWARPASTRLVQWPQGHPGPPSSGGPALPGRSGHRPQPIPRRGDACFAQFPLQL